MKGAKRYMKIILMVFLKKISFGANGLFWTPKMVHHNSGSTPRTFLKFCTMKGAQRYMEIILMVFLKTLSFEANRPFWA